jgi:hypothetical protein
MKMDPYLRYFTCFFLEWEMFQTKVLEKIEIHILCVVNALWKSCRLGENTEKYGRDRLATDDNMMRRMRFAGYLSSPSPPHTHTQNI